MGTSANLECDGLEYGRELMTTYEILTLVISGIAVLVAIGIPLAGLIYRKLQKPKLDIYQFEYLPLIVMYATLGNRIRFNFSIICKKASCIIRTIEAKVVFESKNDVLEMRWALMEPISSNWADGMGSVINMNSMTFVHPLLVNADSLLPLSVQFEPMDNTDFKRVYERAQMISEMELGSNLEEQELCKHSAVAYAGTELGEVIRLLKEQCFWRRGRFKLRIKLLYDADKTYEKTFLFDLTEEDAQQLQLNGEKLILCKLCPKRHVNFGNTLIQKDVESE